MRITGRGLTVAAEFTILWPNSFRGGGIKPEIIPFEPDLDHASVGKRIRAHRPHCDLEAVSNRKRLLLFSVHPEMVDFGSGQGRSDFATAGVEVVS
jgi:hypothetical protein